MPKPLSDQCVVNIEVNIFHTISPIWSLWSPVCITLRTCFKYSAAVQGTAGLGGFPGGGGAEVPSMWSRVYRKMSFCIWQCFHLLLQSTASIHTLHFSRYPVSLWQFPSLLSDSEYGFCHRQSNLTEIEKACPWIHPVEGVACLLNSRHSISAVECIN